MKKVKKILIFIIIILMLNGCSLADDFSDSYLYTTMYPLEYGTQVLFGDYAIINSVYPNGADTTYEVTSKKKKKYATAEIFVYTGLNDEAYLARDLLNINGNLKIIDATKGMNLNNDVEEIWLDPSNYLMLCSNIKSSLIDYNDNVYVKETIEDNYTHLNEKISELDVALYNIGKNGKYNTILTTNDVFNYLSKYNIDVISIDSDKESIDKEVATAKTMISEKKIQYIYLLDDDVLTETQEKFIADNGLVKISINNLYTLSDDERNEDEDYISLMKAIIEEYKRELYKN